MKGTVAVTSTSEHDDETRTVNPDGGVSVATGPLAEPEVMLLAGAKVGVVPTPSLPTTEGPEPDSGAGSVGLSVEFAKGAVSKDGKEEPAAGTPGLGTLLLGVGTTVPISPFVVALPKGAETGREPVAGTMMDASDALLVMFPA